MKKILIFLGLFVYCGLAFSQDDWHYSTLENPGDDVFLLMFREGGTYKVYKSGFNRDVIQDIESISNGISSWNGVTLDFSGDTMEITKEGTTRKYLQLGSETKDIIAPEYLHGNVGLRGPDSVYVEFTEATQWTNPVSDNWFILVDNDTVNISGLFYDETSITFKLSSNVIANEIVLINHVQPTVSSDRISDLSGNYLKSFSSSVVNNVLAVGDTIHPLVWLKGNNNLLDETGNYNGVGHGTVLYDTENKISGSHAINLETGSIELGSLNLNDSFSVCYWWEGDETVTNGAMISFANRTSSSNNPGVMIWHSSYNSGNGYIWVYTGNGSSQEAASAGNWLEGPLYHHIVITVKPGIARIYCDGQDVTSDSTILSDYTYNGNNVVFGAGNDYASNSGGTFDDLRIFDRYLTPDQVSFIYQNPELELSTNDHGDDSVVVDSINMLMSLDIDTHADQKGFTEAELQIIAPTSDLQGEYDETVETFGIVTVGDQKVFRSYHDLNTCCCENQGSYTNGGSGVLWDIPINSDRSIQRSGYMRYTANWPIDYSPGDGAKMPGIRSGANYGSCMTLAPMLTSGGGFRTMTHVNVPGYVDIQWYNYIHLYWDYCYGRTHSVEGSGLPDGIIARVPMGIDQEFTVRYFQGNTGVKDGFVELFINKVLVDSWTGISFTESASIGMRYFEFATHAGGGDVSYYATQDTFMDIFDVELYEYEEGTIGVPAYNVPSAPGRVLTY